MSRIAGTYHIYFRRDIKRYQITIYPVSGLPRGIRQVGI
jgi:hypothetical protein